MKLNELFRATPTPRPRGHRVGWCAIKRTGQREFVRQASTGMRDALWSTGRYECVRGLFSDGTNYFIEV